LRHAGFRVRGTLLLHRLSFLHCHLWALSSDFHGQCRGRLGQRQEDRRSCDEAEGHAAPRRHGDWRHGGRPVQRYVLRRIEPGHQVHNALRPPGCRACRAIDGLAGQRPDARSGRCFLRRLLRLRIPFVLRHAHSRRGRSLKSVFGFQRKKLKNGAANCCPVPSQTGVKSRLFFLEVQTMRKILFAAISTLLSAIVPAVCYAQIDTRWKIHDPDRPVPPVIDPGTPSTQDSPGRPPSDAVVLFDGKDLSKWAHKDGSAAKWKAENGYMETVPKTGYLYTRD